MYKYHYLENNQQGKRIETIETFAGDVVHLVLADLYRPLMITKQWTTVGAQNFFLEEETEDKTDAIKPFENIDEFIDHFKAVWNNRYKELQEKKIEIQSKNKTALKKYFYRSLKILEQYWKKNYPFKADRTLGVEMDVEVVLDDPKYTIVGLIDRVSMVGKFTYNIIDYKTYKRLPSTQKILEMSKQLELYEFAIRNKYPDAKRINLIWDIVSHGETIRITKNLDDPIDQQYLTKLITQTKDLIDTMQNAETDNNFPPKVGMHCKWCEYRHICPAWQGKPPMKFDK